MKTKGFEEIDEPIIDLEEVDGLDKVEEDDFELEPMGSFFTSKRQLRMYIRWALTFVLYYFFWHITWVPWTLVVVAPLILLNLGLLLYFHFVIKRKISSGSV